MSALSVQRNTNVTVRVSFCKSTRLQYTEALVLCAELGLLNLNLIGLIMYDGQCESDVNSRSHYRGGSNVCLRSALSVIPM